MVPNSLASVAQLLGALSRNQKVADLTPSQVVRGQMTQKKSWGSEVEFIYSCGPRGGSLQILGTGVEQKPVYIGRGAGRDYWHENVGWSMARSGKQGLTEAEGRS